MSDSMDSDLREALTEKRTVRFTMLDGAVVEGKLNYVAPSGAYALVGETHVPLVDGFVRMYEVFG